MLLVLPDLILAQANPTASPEVIQNQQVRSLPGSLDDVPVFNSNSPELVLREGILLSTFPPQDKKNPRAHLNFPFRGRFDVFSHHVAKADPPENLRSLYHAIILHNPSQNTATVNILHAASYLSQPDAPFIPLESLLPNYSGMVFAGPGSRVMSDILRGKRQEQFPPQIIIPPGESRILLNLPIPIGGLTPPLNGRSTYMRLWSNQTVYAASLAMFAKLNADGSERAPNQAEWEDLLNNGDLSTPRDKIPTPIEGTAKPTTYGRVAGVARGSQWRGFLADTPQRPYLTIPEPGQAFSYVLSTLHGGTLGTGQIQSAPMLVRYPDTAYFAHGNYGIQYSLRLPLWNNSTTQQNVTLALQTPIKENQLTNPGLRFFTTPQRQVFFRGTVRIRHQNEKGQPATKFVHLVQTRGQVGVPLISVNIQPGASSLVDFDFLYPPDASPPQVLTLSTKN